MSQHCKANPCCGDRPCSGIPLPQHSSGLTSHNNVVAAEAHERRIEAYDAGLLSDYGGGDVGWWQDYIRAELARAHDFYAHQIDAALSPVIASGEE